MLSLLLLFRQVKPHNIPRQCMQLSNNSVVADQGLRAVQEPRGGGIFVEGVPSHNNVAGACRRINQIQTLLRQLSNELLKAFSRPKFQYQVSKLQSHTAAYASWLLPNSLQHSPVQHDLLKCSLPIVVEQCKCVKRCQLHVHCSYIVPCLTDQHRIGTPSCPARPLCPWRCSLTGPWSACGLSWPSLWP